MSGKSTRRLVAVTVLIALGAASSGQALSRPSRAERESLASSLLELMPRKVREWLDGRDRQPSAPPQRAARTLKCGGGIDPNGKPCP